MTDPLQRYRSMRDFGATPEPAGEAAQEGAALRFVIQEHHATRLHWDLRLEHDGALASWAVPNALPESPGENRLAVRTEAHPIEYLDFHGEIPAGSYGAGRMTIWDRGTFTVEEWTDDKKVTVVLDGERLTGRYALFHIGPEPKDWMVHRMDEPLDPEREPLPRRLAAMEPADGELPEGDGWAYEVLWPGERVTVVSEPGRLHVYDALQREVTDLLPEVRPVNRALSSATVVLDGVLVAFDGDGRPDGERARRRLRASGDAAARRAARADPLTLVLVDLLYSGGRRLFDTPYRERRERLDALGLEGPAWRAPAFHEGDGPLLAEAVAAQGLPGLIAKRLDSPYAPGRVNGDWVRARREAQADGPRDPLARARTRHAQARDAAPDADEVELRAEGVLEITGAEEDRREALLALRGMLDQLGLVAVPLVTGAAVEVWVPFGGGAGREEIERFLGALAATLDGALAATVAAHTRRAGAPYARPALALDWEEAEDAPLTFTEGLARERLVTAGDRLGITLSTVQAVPGA